MSTTDTRLRVIMYHYVRDLPRSRFPRIKGLLTDAFRRQVIALCERYEMATLESALDFLAGRYQPDRDLCLLTFDDGLKEHAAFVSPLLADRRLQGIFFLTTSCLQGRVVSVHKNHFLMAALEFADYRRAFLENLARLGPETDAAIDMAQARIAYRFDSDEVAAFKYLLNFRLPQSLRSRVLDALFEEHLGDEAEFADELYVNWEEARRMQDMGMVLGGHSHRHIALATLSPEGQRSDLETCATLLRRGSRSQALWPFSYPYGTPGVSFDATTIRIVSDLGFSCAFTTAVGANAVGSDRFQLLRMDTNDLEV